MTSHGCRRQMMVWLAVTCLSIPMGAQQNSEEGPKKTIVLRIIDGKTGWPIRIFHESPNIWIGDAKSPENPRTNWRGEVHLDVPDGGLQQMRVLPNWYADCRYGGDVQEGTRVVYSIAEILENGIVSNNVCGAKRSQPVPGVLVLYVRSRTLKELMAL